MELIYLWVEEYKNIKQQGFNFSPRFKCEFKAEYDENLNLKDNSELIIEKKEYKSIFPKNINITAIVGENGSGKSSLLESLIDIFSKSISNDEDYSKYILIYKYQSKYFYLKKHIKENINIVDKNTINWISENPNDRLFSLHSELLGLIIQNEVIKNIYLESEQIFIEEVQNKDKNKIKKYIVVNSLFDSKFKKESNKFFDVKNVEIKIKWGNLFNSEEEGNKYPDNTILAELETKFSEAKENFKNKKYKDTFLNIIDLCEMKIEKLKKSGFEEFVLFSGRDPYLSNQLRYRKLYNCSSHIEKNQDIKSVHQLVINDLDKFDNFIFKIEELDPRIIDFIFDLPEYIFDISLKDENKSFEDLSFGERQILIQLNFIQFYINKKQYIQYEGIDFHIDEDNQKHEIDIDVEKKVKNMIVLIDELEIGLHPNWQKNALNYIFDFLQNIKDIDFNLIITSHSPFILSDLPKENVIFLEKYNEKDKEVEKKLQKVGNCKNMSNDIELKTFGANIHTLLSHGFFMSDGLMGEFAKSKITEIKKFYDDNKNLKKNDSNFESKKDEFEKNKKYFENVQKIIGEPFLQTIIKNYLDELEILFNGKNQFLDNEIKRLQSLKDD